MFFLKNHAKNEVGRLVPDLSSTQTKKKKFKWTKFVIEPVKGFHLVWENTGVIIINVFREIPACRALIIHSFISLEKGKGKVPNRYQVGKDVIENLFLLFGVIAYEHVGTRDTLGCKAR